MSTKVVGKLDSFDDADLGGSDFVNLDEGNNPLRIITSPYQFYSHWHADATGANRKVRCALDGCPLCQQGDRATARWIFGVINRKTNKPGILEIGAQIFKQVHALAKSPKWGDPRRFDIVIIRGPKGNQPLYTVVPEPKEALTDDDKSMVKEFTARVDFAKISASSTPEEVREKLGLVAPAKAEPVSNEFEDAESDTPAEATGTEDSDDFDFSA